MGRLRLFALLPITAVILVATLATSLGTAHAAPPQPRSPTGLLPAPLYFIDRATQQIARLETDGVTVHPITDEPQPITAFDVSPLDGSLVYVTDNMLYQSDADGGNRLLKVPGERPELQPKDDWINRQISAPYFSPDGRRIAFALNGVNLIDSGPAMRFATILANSPYPDLNDPKALQGEPIRFFWPRGWSPDGSHLLVEYGWFPEGGGLALYDLAQTRARRADDA